MKAQELRIGNWIRLYVNHSETTEFIIELADLNLIANGRYGMEYQPIQLTEEWLVKFGFENVNTGAPYLAITNDVRIVFPIKNTDKYAYIETDIEPNFSNGHCGSSSQILTNIQYVHQLQNLYFALTGLELTLTK